MALDHITLYVLFVIFLATLLRSTLGFGEALVAVPLLALRVPVAIAASLAVAISVLVAAVIIVQDHRKIEVRSAAWLTLSSLFGIPIGLFLLIHIDDHLFKMVLGLVIVFFSVYSLTARTKLHLEKDSWPWLLGCGFFSGILGGAYGMNGPPLAVYGALRRWSPQHFRATLQGYFFVASLVGLGAYLLAGLWQPLVTRYALLSLPVALLAIFLGRALNQRMQGDGFFKFVYAGLILIGAILLVQALLQ